MYKLKTAAVAAASLAIMGSFAVSAEAATETGPAPAAAPGCPADYVCFWTGANFTGSRYQFSYHGALGTGCNEFGPPFKSVVNGSQARFYYFSPAHPGCAAGGASGTLEPVGRPGSVYSNYLFEGLKKT